MKRLQLFINRYNDFIKLVILLFVVAVFVLTILGQIQKNNRDSAARDQEASERAESQDAIIKAIRDEAATQTSITSRQFRALCILLIDISGMEALNRLDPETRARCEGLAAEPTARLSPPAAPLSRSTDGQESQSMSLSYPNNTPLPLGSEPDNSQNPEEPDNDGIIIDLPLLPKLHIPSPL